MSMPDSVQLLCAYAERGDEAAFRELVARYIDLVHSVAVRRVGGDVEAARDVTQRVFIDLARKARSLRGEVMLGGWLHRHTGFVAASVARAERRRQAREQQAAEMNTLHPTPDPTWQQLAPVLDETIDALDAADRQAILLRFFEQRDFRAVGAALGISDDAAQKRVSRAVEKLRTSLARRGITLSLAALAAFLTVQAVSAAPAGLAAQVSRAACAAGAAGSGLLVGLLAPLAAAKTPLLIGGAAALVILAGALLPRSPSRRTVAPVTASAESVPQPVNAASSASTGRLTNAEAAAGAGAAGSASASCKLVLRLVAADVGLPVPSVPIDCRVWQSGHFFDRHLTATRKGVCVVSYPTNLSSIELTTRTEGFADTRLVWESEHGDAIPQAYTVRLDRAVPIGGSVVDPDGRPVAGATIRFRCRQALDAPGLTTRPQSHDFQECATTTDHEGRWRLERIAEDMLRWTDCVASHPLYASAVIPFANDSNTEKRFRAGQYVFHLGRAPNLSVGGIVTDPSGQLVGGATVTWGGAGEMPNKRVQSNAKGHFYLGEFDPGPLVISAKAEGWAAVGKNVEVKTGMEPVELRLKPARPLRLCVLSQSGEPIRDAAVWMTPGKYLEDQPAAPALTRIDSHTDAAGRVVLKETPDEEIGLVCAAFGFRRVKMKLRPDDQEHVITMARSLRVSGTVRNATTGELVPSFWVNLVWPATNAATGEVQPDWQGGGPPGQHFSNGSYWAVTDWHPSGWFLRCEADGYWPAVSRFITEVEGELNLDVQMQPGTMISVIKQDGTPARMAQVGIVASGGCLQLAPFGFDPSGCEPYGGWGSLHTDAAGRFCLPPDERIQRVFVSDGSGGWAEATPTELAAHPVMQLRAWCMVRGACLANGQPAADRLITLQWANHDHSELDLQRFARRTDQGGGFLMFGLPAGRYVIAEARAASSGNQTNNTVGLKPMPSVEIEVNPGENKQVTLPLDE